MSGNGGGYGGMGYSIIHSRGGGRREVVGAAKNLPQPILEHLFAALTIGELYILYSD